MGPGSCTCALIISFLDTGFRIAKVAALDQKNAQARSSVVEHYLDTVGVGGSIPPVPTRTLGDSFPKVFGNFRCESCRALPANGFPGWHFARRSARRPSRESRATRAAGCYPTQPLIELMQSKSQELPMADGRDTAVDYLRVEI